ncbi:uncharacterized protein LOC110627544 [Manihot esculenta]|uniref:Uncharacterized protein n=1 Tax=Manihot esculenta TaxID=3983 RepID=A0A2C9UVU9_MANES|nr:uncharacterized protein LOC110627544 [Manihot esculenta]OAY35261.1 hypothetical protein MANES_12G085400v8 [Manihot esculenta]
MKDVSKNKFMLCFRPVVNVDEVVPGSKADDKCSNDQPLACVGVDKGKNVKEHLKSNSLILDYRFSKCSGNSLIIHSARKTSFFQSFKSIFFLYSLPKRVRDGKGLTPDSDGSKLDSSSSKSTKSLETSDGDSVDMNNAQVMKTKLVSSCTSSSSKFSRGACLTSTSEPNNLLTSLSKTTDNSRSNKERKSRSKTKGSFVIYLMLFSLAVTVFWGKVCAILFTSISLYIMQYVSDNIRPSENATSLPKRRECKEYKKRIIMEGLLERNRRHVPESQRRIVKFLT